MSDPYLDPESGVLKNKLGIRDQDELDEVEREAATAGADVIQDGYGPDRTFDREHLEGLHRQMFNRVYEWAGTMRDENPVIDGEAVDRIELLSKGASMFIPGSMISRGIAVATSHIADRDALRDGTREDFALKAGNTLGELNHVHPFREGNGRTQRAFIEDLGQETGHQVDFHGITRERMLQASIAVNDDPHSDEMRHVMRDATDPERVAILRETRERLERSGVNPDEYRIATPRDGERVEGELSYRDERVAHIASGKDLVVVNVRDIAGHDKGDRSISLIASPFDPGRGIDALSLDERSDIRKQRSEPQRDIPVNAPGAQAPQRGAVDDIDKDIEDALDDRAEELHRKTVTAMRDGLAEIDDPVKVAAAQKVIDRLEEAGRQFRADRENDDRDPVDGPAPEIERARDADVERQTRTASARAIADRDTVSLQAAADRTSREAASREARQIERAERDRDEEDELER